MMEPAASSDNVKVAIRVRQLIQKELAGGLKSHWTVKNDTICCDEVDSVGRKPTPYSFDRVFEDTTVTMDIFEEVCKPIVDAAIDGFNGTIFAYGQSSSGKTFTMLGNKVQPGVITLAVNEIFHAIDSTPDREFLIRVGYLEIYNERVSDLLSSEEKFLKLQEDTDHNIQVVGLTEEMVNDKSSIMAVLQRGNAKRHTAETKQNDRSSRSHCILRIVIESRQVGHEDDAVNVSNLYFVDLAGSEKAGDNSGDRFREGCAINKSLFTLGMVIRKLTGDSSQQHVSIRDSKLTRILKNALGGNCKTAIICTVTPAHMEESESTLKFASRAKNICNNAKVNEVMSEAAILKRYRSEIKKLEMQIREMNDTHADVEKVELERRLHEKEAAEKEQAEMIAKLRIMIVKAGPSGVLQEPPKKKRRETWCPGKATREMAALPEFSPPRPHKKASLESKVSLPALEPNVTVFEEEPPTALVDETINQNPAVKELFELQDKHELLLEELQKKDSELKELQEFTELERQSEAETISELKEKIQVLESNTQWLEEEQLKTQMERNGLRQKVETMNRRLTTVEDGTGMTEKSKQLTESKSINAELNSELDIQKSRYEFHIEQMRKKLETYQLMLEEKGVDADHLKQRMSADWGESTDSGEIRLNSSNVTSKQKEIDELRNEIDMLVIGSEKSKQKMEEMNARFEAELEEQKARFQKDLEEARDEIEIYMQLLQEEKNKSVSSCDKESEAKTDLEKLTEKYEQQISEMKSQIEEFTIQANETKHIATNELISKLATPKRTLSEGDAAVDAPPSTKKKIRKHVNFNIGSEVEIQKELFGDKLQERDDVIAALEKAKAEHEHEMCSIQAEVNRYKEMYEEEKQKLQKQLENEEKHPELLDHEKENDNNKTELQTHSETMSTEHSITDEEKSQNAEIERLQLQIKELKENHVTEIEQMKSEFANFVEVNFLNAHSSAGNGLNAIANSDLQTQESNKDTDIQEEINADVTEPGAESTVISNVGTEKTIEEVEEMKREHSETIKKLEDEVAAYKEILEQEKVKQNNERTVDNECRTEKLEEELATYKMLLEQEKAKQMQDITLENDSRNLSSEIHSDEIHCSEEIAKPTNESSDLQTEMLNAELCELKDKYFKEVEAKEDELSSYKLLLDQERVRAEEKAEETNIRIELLTSEMNDLKESHAKELEALDQKCSSYKELLEEGKAANVTETAESKSEAETSQIDEKIAQEDDLSSHKLLLEQESVKAEEMAEETNIRIEMLISEMNNLKDSHAKELETLTEELSSYKRLVEEGKAVNIMENDQAKSEAEISQMEEKIAQEDELSSYKLLLDQERVKAEEKAEETNIRIELLTSEMNDLKESHAKELEVLDKTLSSYKQLLEEGKAEKILQNAEAKSEAEISQIEEKIAQEDELSSYKLLLDQERAKAEEKAEETNIRIELLTSEMNDLKESHAKELEVLDQKFSSYKLLLEEGKAEQILENAEAKSESEISPIEEKIAQEGELSSYKLLLDQERAKAEEKIEETNIRIELLTSEISDLRESHAKELEALTEELSSYKQLLDEKAEKLLKNSEAKSEAEISQMEEQIEQEDELSSYKLLLDQERAKAEEKAEETTIRIELLTSEMNELKEKHVIELEMLAEELRSYKLLLEEEKVQKLLNNSEAKHETEMAQVEESTPLSLDQELAKAAENAENTNIGMELLSSEINEQRERHAKELEELSEELSSYKLLLEQERAEKLSNDIEAKYETEIAQLKEEIENYKKSSNEETEDNLKITVEEQLSSLKHKHADEIETLNNKISAYKDLLTELETKSPENTSKLDKSEVRDAATDSMVEMRDGCQQTSSQVAVQSVIEETQQELQAVREQMELLSKEIYRQQQANTKLKAEKVDLINHRDLQQEKLDQLETDLKNVKEELSLQEEENDIVKSRVTDLEEYIKLGEGMLADKNKEIETLKLSLEEQLSAADEEVERRTNEAREQCASLEEKVSSLESELRLLSEKIAESEISEGQFSSQIVNLESELETAKEREITLNNLCSEYEDKIVLLETDKELAAAKHQELSDEFSDSKKEVERLKFDLELAQSKDTELKDVTEAYQVKIAGLEEELKNAQTRERELASEKTVLNEKIAGIEEELKNAQTREREMESVKTVLDEKLALLEKELQNANSRVSDIEEETRQLEGMKKELEAASSRVKELEEIINKGKIHLEQVQNRLEDTERDAADTVKDLENRLESVEKDKEDLKNEVDRLNENTKGTTEISAENAYLKERVEALQNDRVISDDLISEYESEVKELRTRISALKEKEDTTSAVEIVKQELEEKISDLETERNLLSAKLENNVAETESWLKSTETERDDLKLEMDVLKKDLGERLGALEEENKKAKEEVESLRQERDSLEDDVTQLRRDKDPVTIHVNPESDSEWEKRWVEFTREEKTKRAGLIVQIRNLKKSLEYEKFLQENAKEKALQELIREGKDKEAFTEIEERYKKADEDANRLNADLEDEREETQRLRQKIEKLEVQLGEMQKLRPRNEPLGSQWEETQRLKQKIEKLEIQLKDRKGGGFVSSTDHSCDFRLENVQLKQQLKEAKWESDEKVKSYESLIDHYKDRISKTKNEMRRMQSNQDSFVCPSSTGKQQQQADTSSEIVGSSAGGGIVDHFRVCVVEAEKRQLTQELAQLKKQLARYEELDKENRGLRHELKKLKSRSPVKQKDTSQATTPKEPSFSRSPKKSTSSSRDDSLSTYPLAEMMQKALQPSPQQSKSEILEMVKKVPKYTDIGLPSCQKKKPASDFVPGSMQKRHTHTELGLGSSKKTTAELGLGSTQKKKTGKDSDNHDCKTQ